MFGVPFCYSPCYMQSSLSIARNLEFNKEEKTRLPKLQEQNKETSPGYLLAPSGALYVDSSPQCSHFFFLSHHCVRVTISISKSTISPMQLNAKTIIWRSIPTYPNVLVVMVDICAVAMNALCAFFYIFILDFFLLFQRRVHICVREWKAENLAN